MDRLAFLLPESRPREALSWPSKCRSGNEQDRAAEAPEAAGRAEEEITKGGRKRKALSRFRFAFTLIFLRKGRSVGAPHIAYLLQ